MQTDMKVGVGGVDRDEGLVKGNYDWQVGAADGATDGADGLDRCLNLIVTNDVESADMD